ncbi:MAG TPA: CDP-alcohol phosphatidyltransferase family protein [Chryseolinea sp.]
MNVSTVSYYIVNGLTLYRLASAPIILLLAMRGELTWIRWLIAVSFFTDAIDGPLSRKLNVTSVFGSRLDSVADDATVLVSTLGLWIIFPEFMREHWMFIAGLFALFAIQTVVALIIYKKTTSFHTYLAKAAAIAQALFFISIFFNFGPVYVLFFSAVTITAVELIEEIILVFILPKWEANVKGLYWILRSRKTSFRSDK